MNTSAETRKHNWYRFTDGDRYMMRCENCGKERGAGSYPKDVLGPCDGGRPSDTIPAPPPCDERDETIRALKAQNRIAIEAVVQAVSRHLDAERELSDAKDEVARLRSALEFYANEDDRNGWGGPARSVLARATGGGS